MRFVRLSTIITVTLLLSALVLAGCSSGGSNDPDPPEADTTPPSAPSGLTASSGDAEVGLEWDAVSASDLEGYNLYRATASIGDVSDQSPINSAPLTETSFTDADVSNGTTYFYRVTAVDESGNESTASGEVTVTPFPDPPDRP